MEANQSTAFDKKIVQNKNTSVQSRLGEHGPLQSIFGCQLLKFFISLLPLWPLRPLTCIMDVHIPEDTVMLNAQLNALNKIEW